jgi:hypothetical protein
LLLALLAGSGCGQAPDALAVSFADELVEAPARTIRLTVVRGASCAELLTAEVESLADQGTVLVERTGRYPVAPEAALLEGLPRGEALSFHVAAHAADDVRVARDCAEATLEPDQPTTVAIELLGLPACEARPTALDLTLVLDTSRGMQSADLGLGGALIESLAELVESGFAVGSSLSVVAHGHVAPAELSGPSDEATTAAALRELEGVSGGEAVLYRAIAFASQRMRARARCGRQPAMLVVAGGSDASAPGELESAVIGLVATRGERRDDLPVYAIAVSPAARADLDYAEIADYGEVAGVLTRAALEEALRTARARMQALVGQ